MEKADSRRITVRLTQSELKKFYRYDMLFTQRAVWNAVIILAAVLIYLAVIRTFTEYKFAVIIVGGIFLAGLLYNMYCLTPAMTAQRTAPGEYGIISELEFFGTYFTEKKGRTFTTIPYGAIEKAVERETAFYLYFVPSRTRVQKVSEDGGLEPAKNRSAMASVITKEGLTEEEKEFIRTVVTPNKEVN